MTADRAPSSSTLPPRWWRASSSRPQMPMGIPPVHDMAPPPPTLRYPQPWVTQPERGNDQLLRAMSVLSLRCGRRLSRVVLFLVVIYYWLRPGEAAVHIARFQS